MGAVYKYGRMSKRVRITLHPDLRRLFDAVLAYRDHTLLRGLRTVDEQRNYVEQGLSLTMDSRHLPGGGYDPKDPTHPELSYAVDVAPFIGGAVSYEERHVANFIGYVQRVADELGIAIRWGGDWDSDGNQVEHALWDGVHVELLRSVYT